MVIYSGNINCTKAAELNLKALLISIYESIYYIVKLFNDMVLFNTFISNEHTAIAASLVLKLFGLNCKQMPPMHKYSQ